MLVSLMRIQVMKRIIACVREGKKKKKEVTRRDVDVCVYLCIMMCRGPRERITRLHRTLSASGRGHR